MIDIYIFATNAQNSLVSYPQDQTHEYFQYAIKMSRNNVQIVLVRKDNLLHYCYVRRIGSKQAFGLCLRIDRIYSNVDDLFRAFNSSFTSFVEAGIFLQMNSESNIILRETNFAKETVAIREMSDNLIHSLGINQKNTLALPPADYSVSINDCIELSIEGSTTVQIINAIKKYSNVYIVKTHDEIARVTEFAKLIKNIKEENRRLQDTIIHQDDNISELKKQKNKYKWVVFLLTIIFIGAIVFFNVMQSKNDSIYVLGQENAQLMKHVKSLQSDSSTLVTDLIQTKTDLSTANKKLNRDSLKIDSISQQNRILNDHINELLDISANYRADISNLQRQLSVLPIKIEICNKSNSGIDIDWGNNIEASRSMFLATRFECYSNKSQELPFVLKLFRPNGELICSTENRGKGYTDRKQFSLKRGKNVCEYQGWGGENRGFFSAGKYRCEIWVNDIKIGDKQFILYE